MSYESKKTDLLDLYPAIEDLARKAQKRMPFISWEYLESGTSREELIQKNLAAFKKIILTPRFCKGNFEVDTNTELLGRSYPLPFGMAPVGLTGLMWPKAEIYLAQTAKKYGIPFSLSTVATQTPETVGPYVGDMGWFQLYPPRDQELRSKILTRAWESGFHTLLITADVPTPSRRERTKRAGLRVPPKLTPALIWQALTHPSWTINMLKNGRPKLKIIEPYANLEDIKSIGAFVGNQLGGNLSWEYCKETKEEWQGPVILKGLLHPDDALKAIDTGMDAIVVSNHGGRQFDGAPPAIEVLPTIVKAVNGQIPVIYDSGIRSGLDILRALHQGADFVLLGRPFLYGVAALGEIGGHHVVEILKDDLQNNMMQLGLQSLSGLKT